ncbi:protein NDRG3-like [Oppia nitens]|uniref:protein NDRG3-like n=1 Tax=Oppia nitens TaxID=1686743 RepID=UPI0023DCAD35|nr:protein NDRG3-like [Oppia nitens]
MPIYYKKVTSNDVNLIEKGNKSFTFGIKRKITNNRSNGSSDGLELNRIYTPTTRSADNRSQSQSLIGEQTTGRSQSFSIESSRLKFKDLDDDYDERIITKYGSLVVTKLDAISNGSSSSSSSTGTANNKPVILTYHDIGLNSSSNFESFFSLSENRLLLESFRVYHITAPGQEFNADDLPYNYVYPTMDQLAEQIHDVCKHYAIQSFIGFGYGAGANVLSRFALNCPDMVEGLFLIHPSATASTWTEWIYQKLNVRQLLNGGQQIVNDSCLPQSVQNYLMWHLFGDTEFPDRVTDDEAVDMYRRYFGGQFINKRNLGLFIDAYIGRSALDITRDDKQRNFRCSVAVICGQNSAHVDESVKMNSRLLPSDSTWIKLSDASMVLEEQPHKVAETFRLFLQGLGYTLKAYRKKRALMMGMSMPCLASSRLSLYGGSAGGPSTGGHSSAAFPVIHEI